jgi:hypothetical protein
VAHGGLVPTRPPIGQALAFGALHRSDGALHIIDTQPSAVIVTKISFGQILVPLLENIP